MSNQVSPDTVGVVNPGPSFSGRAELGRFGLIFSTGKARPFFIFCLLSHFFGYLNCFSCIFVRYNEFGLKEQSKSQGSATGRVFPGFGPGYVSEIWISGFWGGFRVWLRVTAPKENPEFFGTFFRPGQRN